MSSPAKGPGLVPNSIKDNRAVSIENEEDLLNAIKELRNDASGVNW